MAIEQASPQGEPAPTHTEGALANGQPALARIPEDVFNRFRQTLNYAYSDLPFDESDDLDNVLRDEFFPNLYVARGRDEEQLRAWMVATAHDLGTIVGVQGCGKTTLATKVQQLIDPDLYPVVDIDIRALYDEELCDQGPERWHHSVEDAIKGWITDRFLGKGIDKYFRFFLYEDPRANRLFLKERHELNRRYRFEQDRGQVSLPEPDWFQASQDKLWEICSAVDEKLTLYHYLRAARMEAGGTIHHFIFLLDNVDAIPVASQPTLYSIASAIRQVAMAHGNVIIATRPDTAHPSLGDMNGATPIIQLGLYDPDATQARTMPETDFSDIIERRVALFRRDATSPGVEELATISERIIHNLRPTRGEGRLFQALVNQSIRDALHYHTEFIRYALTFYEPKELSELFRAPGSASFVRSMLFGWLTSFGEVGPRPDFNVVGLLRACQQMRYQIPGTDIAYAILTFVYNYYANSHLYPTVGQTAQALRPLGFDEPTVLDAVYRLTDAGKTSTRMIMSLLQKPLPASGVEVRNGATIQPNYRGELLVNQVALSFMFLVRLLYTSQDEALYTKAARARVPDRRFYDNSNLAVHAEQHTHFLFELADLHVLEIARTGLRDGRVDWLHQYERWFCWRNEHQVERAVAQSKQHLTNVTRRGGLIEGDVKVLEKVMALQEWLGSTYRQQIEALGAKMNPEVWHFGRLFRACWDDPDLVTDRSRLNPGDWTRDLTTVL